VSASTRFRNHRGELVEAPTFSASDAKNAFGRVLDAAARTGMVTITRHDEARAVLLSIEEYRALAGARQNALDTLSGEFDAMLARMQAPGARKAMQSAFDAPAAELGRIAVKRARRKRG
jgi:antitoxin Phd